MVQIRELAEKLKRSVESLAASGIVLPAGVELFEVLNSAADVSDSVELIRHEVEVASSLVESYREELRRSEGVVARAAAYDELIATGLGSQMSIGREAYEAYARHTRWKSLATGQDLPQWADLREEIQAAWMVSAAWVAGRVMRKFGVGV